MEINNNIELPDNHKRSLSVTARHIEQGIEEIESLLNNQRPDNSTSEIIKNLSPEVRSLIINLLKKLKAKNEMMIKAFNLPPQKLYEDRMVRGRINHIWVLLSDSTAKSLKGYGELSGEQAESVDRYVNSLLDIVDELQAVVK